jgi:phosphoribosylanthranilate isomerase
MPQFRQRPRIKICCIQNSDEARMAIRYGASAVGLVSAMPSGPGPIDEERIAEIAATIPPGVASFLLTCKQGADEIVSQQRRLRATTLQLVDTVPVETYSILREELPGIGIVQVIHVRGEEAVDEAVAVAPHVDAILLDSGNPSLAVKELGGTGRVHDWSVSRKIRDAIGIPLYLAGGLTADNVREAIDRVQPFGVDVCSGVRTNGALQEKRLSRFVRQVLSA